MPNSSVKNFPSEIMQSVQWVIKWETVTLKDLQIKERLAKKTSKVGAMNRFYGTTCAVYRVSLDNPFHCT